MRKGGKINEKKQEEMNGRGDKVLTFSTIRKNVCLLFTRRF